MRFLLYFPLPLLLILGSFISIDSQAAPQSIVKPVPPWSTHKPRLKRAIDDGSFVSIDSQAAPQSVFKPVPPWSTHKPRLKRSIDDSNSTADYDSLSLDELTKLLEETKKTAENEKMVRDAASSAVSAKQEEFDKAKEDYETKKKEWDKWKDFPVLTKASAEAQKVMDETDIPSLNRTYLDREHHFLVADTNWKNANEELDDINDVAAGKDVMKSLNAESDRLTQDIATQNQKITPLTIIKNAKEGELSALINQETQCKSKFSDDKCEDPQKATAEPCLSTISKLDQINQDMPTVKEAAATATQNHKEAEDFKTDLQSQEERIRARLSNLEDEKDDIPEGIKTAEKTLKKAKKTKDRAEKPYLEAKATLEKAQAELAKAIVIKNDADLKLSEYPPDVATKEIEANTAQDKAGRKKIELEGELASLNSDRDEKEKQFNSTNAKVAALERAETAKKSAVSTGGGTNPVAIIVPIVVVIILGLIGVAAFLYLKRRKRMAKQAKASPNSGGAAPSAPSAAAAPEAVDSQNPSAPSQKPPSDPAAAPQPGSTKSNDAAAAAAAPNDAPPVADPAPPAPPAAAVKATEATPVDDANKWKVTKYLKCLDDYCEKFEDFIKKVSDKEHRKELLAVANPGTMVYKLGDSYVLNTEDESGNCYVSVGMKYLKFAQDARRSQHYNAINPDTEFVHKYTKRNPNDCTEHAYYAPNNVMFPFIFESRKTRDAQIVDKKSLPGRRLQWNKLLRESGIHKEHNQTKKRQRAGREEATETMMEEELFDALEQYTEEEQEQIMLEAFLQELTDNVSTCRAPKEPPSLWKHYRHEIGAKFNSFLDSLRCKRGKYDDDSYSFRFIMEQLPDVEDDINIKELEQSEPLEPLEPSEPIEPIEPSHTASDTDDEVSTDRSSAGGGDDSSDKKKRRKKKRTKSRTKKSSEKKSDRSESSRRAKKDGKQDKDSTEDDEDSGDDKKKKGKNNRRRTKKSDKKSDSSRPEKKDGKQTKNDKDSSSSTESDRRSPPRDFLKKAWRARIEEKKAPLMLHGQQIILWDLEYIPDLGRLLNRNEMSMDQIDQVLKEIDEASSKHEKIVPDTEKILDLLHTYFKKFENGDKFLEFHERKKSVSIGDIHGCMDSIHKIFNKWGGVGSEKFKKMKFIFTGDYVDRGSKSLEVIMYVLALAVRYPDNIVVLRGNHEIYSTNAVYGFYEECLERIKDKEGKEKGQEGQEIHFYFNYVFGYMPIVCLHNSALHSHGGMTRTKLKNLQELNKIMPNFMWDPMFCNSTAHDFLWSDPMEGISGFRWDGGRGAYLYGPDVVKDFVEQHKAKVKLIVRGHQVMYNGTEFFAGRLLVCVFTTAGYDLTGYNNHGAVMVIEENYDIYFFKFVGVRLEDRARYKGPVHKAFMEKTAEEHNMNNLYPNMKAAYVKVAEPIADCPSETVRL